MKKILSLFLILAVFLPLCSCSATLEPTPTEQETVQTEEKKTTEASAEEIEEFLNELEESDILL